MGGYLWSWRKGFFGSGVGLAESAVSSNYTGLYGL